MITTASSMPFAYKPGENDIRTTDLEGEMSLVDAAKAANVRHFVYTSFSGNIDFDFPLRNAKRAVEKLSAKERHGLHHPAPRLFHGSLAQSSSRL